MSLDEDKGRSALLAYHAWAVGASDAHAAIDACRLLGALGPADDRVDWLERAVDHAQGDDAEGVGLYRDLAAALDVLDRPDEALEAAEKALEAAQRTGEVRAIVASAWGAGALAMRLDAPDTARRHLDEAIAGATGRDDCEDLLGFALADRAELEADSGDVPEARRLMVRALRIAGDLDFASAAPVQWAQISGLARRLELADD
jgi:tetratricopeptide (TPR) repeat protein